MSTEPDRATLRVVTMPPDAIPVRCDGTYTCDCPRCLTEKASLVRLGVRRTPKPLRRAA